MKITKTKNNELKVGSIIETKYGNIYLICEDGVKEIVLIDLVNYKTKCFYKSFEDLIKSISIKEVFNNNDLHLG